MRIEIIHEIASSLRNNKLRTALTGFAVSWGIFLLVTLLGAGNGLMNSFAGNMRNYISQSIEVEGWRTSKPYKGYKENRIIELDQKDVDYTDGPAWEGIIGDVSVSTGSTPLAESPAHGSARFHRFPLRRSGPGRQNRERMAPGRHARLPGA